MMFTGIGLAAEQMANQLLDDSALASFYALLASFFFSWLAPIVFAAIKGAAVALKAVAMPGMQVLATSALTVMQMELLGTFLWVPVMIAIAVPVITLAVTLAFYAPIITFLIWLLAAINWLIGVIESMVAFPVVALGITSPQGHDFLGKAELFGMLVLAIFIRPVGMIFGFMFAVLIAYFGFNVINFMIYYYANILEFTYYRYRW